VRCLLQEVEREGSSALSISEQGCCDEEEGQPSPPSTDSLSSEDDEDGYGGGEGGRQMSEREQLLVNVDGRHTKPCESTHNQQHHMASSRHKELAGTSGGGEPSFLDKLRAMFGSVHIVLFLLQATLMGYGFGECSVHCGICCWAMGPLSVMFLLQATLMGLDLVSALSCVLMGYGFIECAVPAAGHTGLLRIWWVLCGMVLMTSKCLQANLRCRAQSQLGMGWCFSRLNMFCAC